ncbi:MAG: filamentous hemagglutinin N-terminal domain-containing protein [Scytonema sp. PMC 1069.18]|nr:filamentous hemagglutinin N-terminal domain-containing protein [Scytonema sp. PMC 1069.18]MEC4880260.1 filamentous hemagglutinin N-terminal domain-containing protein [Scytonema sp. PMC 1070.18]
MSGTGTRYGWLLGIAFNGVLIFSAHCVYAQITPDTTLPQNSDVKLDGNTFNITGGTQAGTNLFHSFREFSVNTGNTAFFNNTVDIQNIISRVTGGSISNIDGLIRANGTANLFLLNPNGIVFGPNARLDIGGSFIGSTANRLRFADGTEFIANPANTPPLLTISVPTGLQFGSNPGAIAVQGIGHEYDYQSLIERGQRNEPGLLLDTKNPGLQVPSGKTLALIGGNVSLEGAILKSPAGRIEIIGVGSNGVVNLEPVTEGWKVGYDRTNTPFADILVSNRSFVGTTGVGGGEIAIAGKDISFTSEAIVRADTTGDRSGKGISVVGDSIVMNRSGLSTLTVSSGDSGQIQLDARSVEFSDNGGVGTQTQLGIGKAGDITLEADSIIAKNQSGLGSDSFGAGNGGRIYVNANSLRLEDSGIGANPFSTGNSGDINITVGELVAANNSGIGTTVRDKGSTGNVNITANSVELTGAGINSSTEQGSTGNAGEIIFNVSDVMTVKDAGISVRSEGQGNAGKIRINAKTLQIERAGVSSNTTNTGQAGEIIFNTDSFTFSSGGIITDSTSTSNGGKISIKANSLRIQEGGVNSNTETDSTGNAGEIDIQVTGNAIIQRAGISTNSDGTGNAGKINITAKELQIESAGINSNTTSTGNAGEISFNVTDAFVLKGVEVNTNTSSQGYAGKINVTANSLKLEGASISSSTDNTGQGGEININAVAIVVQGGGVSTNTQGEGNAGTINMSSSGDLTIEGGSITSGTGSRTEKAGTGGEIKITVPGTLTLKNLGIKTNTQGNGNAGTISFNANSINTDSVEISSSTEKDSSGQGGEIKIATLDTLTLKKSSISTNTQGSGNAGIISLNANSLNIDSAGVSSSTEKDSSGQGGEIKIVVDSINLGRGSILANTEGSGKAGNLTIKAKRVVLDPRTEGEAVAKLGVESSGNGDAGNLTIEADTIKLDNKSQITATSITGSGGNIELNVGRYLLLRRQSSISTSANSDGGNITINAPNGFVIGVRNENSDITADANNGRGGRITINSLGIFNWQQRSQREFGANVLNPQQISTNDITAFSLTDPVLEGQITINTPDVDPSQGLVELPTVLTDNSEQIDASCTAYAQSEDSKFIVTGRGGLPPQPEDFLNHDVVWSDTRLQTINAQQQPSEVPVAKLRTKPDVVEINPATGWVFNGNGEVTLISNTSGDSNLVTTRASCAQR